MKACGVVVEYNPFHYGHAYHIQEAKKVSQADCIVAVMSGNFLQRGEPAIIDKYHRAKAALSSGVDLVLELPYAFAVQNSDYFAKGAMLTLHAAGVSSICFGSESGNAKRFISGVEHLGHNEEMFKGKLKHGLNAGLSFPEASMKAYEAIGLAKESFDLSRPNNILGFSYVRAIHEQRLPIEVHTIQRLNNDFHDAEITNAIASATSIRNELMQHGHITEMAKATIPEITYDQLQSYLATTSIWHDWEKYFPLVHYRVQTMSPEELREIHGMDEGLEYRLKKTAPAALTMKYWIEAIKTKRYTWTRIQRLFTHLLTNTKKRDLEQFLTSFNQVPYTRVLGMTERGQAYLHHVKKNLEAPIVSGYSRDMHPLLQLEEKATAAYYSILSPAESRKLSKQEFTAPLRDF